MFKPHLHILPPGQRWLWPRLDVFPAAGFVLYGGTAIALRLGHRVSEDFDFFSDRPLDKRWIRGVLSDLKYEVLQDVENTYTMLIAAPSPDTWIKLSCFGGLGCGRFGEPQVATGSAVAVASPDDLLATKLAALVMRVQSKDYRDIAALIRAGTSLARGLSIAAAMHGTPFSIAQCVKTLTYFEGGDLEELPAEDRGVLCAASAAVGDLPPATRLSAALGVGN